MTHYLVSGDILFGIAFYPGHHTLRLQLRGHGHCL
jgi:hypothetical protein